MSSLADDLSAFKNRLKAQPVLQKRVISSVNNDASSTNNSDDERRKKKPKVTTVFSQPADTGIGSHILTQLHHAVEFIKKHDSPVTVNELQAYLSGQGGPQLLTNLQLISRINYDPINKTYEYRPLHNIRSAEGLLAFLRRQPTFRGLPVKELKDGWSGCMEAIDELEKSGDILVLRTKKEGTPRLVWANKGGDIGGVDEEFVATWQRIAIPPASELPSTLEAAGLKPTSVDPSTVKKANVSTERKQKKPRKGKITNTHLTGILKDFSGRR
ncbi:TFIIE beta subunit core domain-containing protein [Lipomyces kononenkoae]|uniref:TFIIE beta subunit core domain-containing protein n=1 Tax=Lipomyces kononenkoae TaxID=34357 RepID=A0ACC3SS47_LIPKO